jgi:hypothetical protein
MAPDPRGGIVQLGLRPVAELVGQLDPLIARPADDIELALEGTPRSAQPITENRGAAEAAPIAGNGASEASEAPRASRPNMRRLTGNCSARLRGVSDRGCIGLAPSANAMAWS